MNLMKNIPLTAKTNIKNIMKVSMKFKKTKIILVLLAFYSLTPYTSAMISDNTFSNKEFRETEKKQKEQSIKAIKKLFEIIKTKKKKNVNLNPHATSHKEFIQACKKMLPEIHHFWKWHILYIMNKLANPKKIKNTFPSYIKNPVQFTINYLKSLTFKQCFYTSKESFYINENGCLVILINRNDEHYLLTLGDNDEQVLLKIPEKKVKIPLSPEHSSDLLESIPALSCFIKALRRSISTPNETIKNNLLELSQTLNFIVNMIKNPKSISREMIENFLQKKNQPLKTKKKK